MLPDTFPCTLKSQSLHAAYRFPCGTQFQTSLLLLLPGMPLPPVSRLASTHLTRQKLGCHGLQEAIPVPMASPLWNVLWALMKRKHTSIPHYIQVPVGLPTGLPLEDGSFSQIENEWSHQVVVPLLSTRPRPQWH